MVKFLFPLILLGFAFTPLTHSPKEITWLDMETAIKKAKKTKQPIFVDVYTSWCGWCKKMDKATFADPAVAQYVAKNYLAVKLNAESQETIKFGKENLTARALAKERFAVKGYPTIVLLSPDLQKIQAKGGFKDADAFVKMLQKFKQKSD
ncbi:MAG: thioredoxin family protein [Bernardetiaceae bacterium]